MDNFSNFSKSFVLTCFLYLIMFLFVNILWFTSVKYIYFCIFFVSFLFSTIFYFRKNSYISILWYFFVFFIFHFLFKNIFDISFDWNTYHLDAVLQILDWKNIFYDDFWNYSNFLSFYPKTIEILFSMFSLFWSILDARILKVFLIFITFSNYFYLLKKFSLKNNFLNILIWILFILNPVVINQFFTLYIDDVLFLMLVNLIFYVFNGEMLFWLILLWIIWSAKITYLWFWVWALFLWIFLRKIVFEKDVFFQIKETFKYKTISTFTILWSLFVLLHNYILNFINKWNLFYGFIWKSPSIWANMASDKPPILQTSKLNDFFYTFASNTTIWCKTDNSCIKLMDFFSLNWIKDILNSYKLTYVYDLLTSWFWGFYSVAIFLSIILIISYLWVKTVKKDFDKKFKIIFWVSIYVFVFLLIMPIYWARYVVFISFLVFIALSINKFFSKIIIFLLLINFLWFSIVNLYFYTNKIINQLNQKELILPYLKDIKWIYYYKADPLNSFEIEYFKDYYRIKNEEILVSKENILDFCWIQSDIEIINFKLKYIKCPNSWILLKTNIWSFLEDLIYIDNIWNKKASDFTLKKPILSINWDEIIVNNNTYKINYNFSNSTICEKWYKKMSKNDFKNLIYDLWIYKNDFISFLDIKKSWYIDKKNEFIKNNQFYFLTLEKVDNKSEIVIFAKNRFEYLFYKDINQKFLNLCLKD